MYETLTVSSISGVRPARVALHSFVTAAGAGDVSDDAVLVLSELLTNALTHTPGPAVVEFSITENMLHICVSDPSTVPPNRVEPAFGAPHGRGLALVGVLCTSHGWDVSSKSKKVWAVLSTQSAVKV